MGWTEYTREQSRIINDRRWARRNEIALWFGALKDETSDQKILEVLDKNRGGLRADQVATKVLEGKCKFDEDGWAVNGSRWFNRQLERLRKWGKVKKWKEKAYIGYHPYNRWGLT